MEIHKGMAVERETVGVKGDLNMNVYWVWQRLWLILKREVALKTEHFFVEADLEEPLVKKEGHEPPNSESHEVQSITIFLTLPLVMPSYEWMMARSRCGLQQILHFDV